MFESKILDVPAILYALPTSCVSTFADYNATKVFIPSYQTALKNVDRIDILCGEHVYRTA